MVRRQRGLLDAHEMAARLYINTYPEVEYRVTQSESEKPDTGSGSREKRRPIARWCERYMRTR
eukprot:4081471-Pleurochrysis_carterae.AAC.2